MAGDQVNVALKTGDRARARGGSEEWVVAAIEGTRVHFMGYPHTVLPADQVELVAACEWDVHVDMMRGLVLNGHDTRGRLAALELGRRAADALPLVYVAGPYSSDPVRNTREAIVTGDRLMNEGCCAVIVPHLSLLADMTCPRPYANWIANDLAIVRRCDAVYRLPGESRGADEETALARGRGLPVFTAWPDLVRFCWGRVFQEVYGASLFSRPVADETAKAGA